MLTYNLNKDVSLVWGDKFIKISGPKGEIIKRKSDFSLAIKEGKLYVWSQDHSYKENAYLSWIHQLIIGVTKGYTKKLRLIGVGYRASIVENKLILICVKLILRAHNTIINITSILSLCE